MADPNHKFVLTPLLL